MEPLNKWSGLSTNSLLEAKAYWPGEAAEKADREVCQMEGQ